jgi:hypothetical protein
LFKQSTYKIKQKHTNKTTITTTTTPATATTTYTTITTTTTYALLSFCDEPELSTCLNGLAERREKS